LPITVNASSSGGWNWIRICRDLDPVLIPSCNSLVYQNNVLTSEGERAVGCIRNGLFLAGGGIFLLSIPVEYIIPILRVLQEPTGCGGIVEWSYIGNVGNLKGIIDVLTLGYR